jgi:hypothetical protein
VPAPDRRFPYRNELEMPVIGLEAEFKVFLDDEEVVPEEIWRTPAGFIDQPLLRRSSKSSQLPTGGAVYFDGGVLEVVTPVIEIAPQCTARMVRSLWEQIDFVRDHLDRWEARNGKRVRLQAFSCHVNVSFELGREERSSDRTIQKLAYLLAHVLPVPIAVTSANRRSTGIGVRPRRDRIEMTLDFTPDPGLMSASAAMIVGIVREVISQPSYRLEAVPKDVPILTGVSPAKHPTRKGWVVRNYHFPRDPFAANIDSVEWETSRGLMSLRQIALATATAYRASIKSFADAFSYRLLFATLRGQSPALLDLADRPAEYDDVGRLTRWGTVLPELKDFSPADTDAGDDTTRRRLDPDATLSPPWRRNLAPERRGLTRSVYENVFRNLASGKHLKIDEELLTPIGVKGWYHGVFRDARGEERMLTIDQIQASGVWL